MSVVKFNFRKPEEQISGIDHKDLLNKGINTHEEIDNIVSEVEESRGIFTSLKGFLDSIISNIQDVASSIITDHKKLSNAGVKTHSQLDALWSEVDEAKDGFSTLKLKLDSLKPKLKLSELEDVNVSEIKNGETIIYDSSSRKFIPGVATGGGGGTQSKLAYEVTAEYNSENYLIKETYSGDIKKTVTYEYNPNKTISKKTVTNSDGSIYTASYSYDTSGNLIEIIDTGTEEVLIAGGGSGGDIPQDAERRILNLETFKNSTTKTIIQMQFKYDIALNLTRNKCSDYFIDVLDDSLNIEEYNNCSYNPTTEVIS